MQIRISRNRRYQIIELVQGERFACGIRGGGRRWRGLPQRHDMLHPLLPTSHSSYFSFRRLFLRRLPALSIKHPAGQYEVIEEKASGVSEISTTTTVLVDTPPG
jgi:hypothetical protein